jgi:hypothetical protein
MKKILLLGALWTIALASSGCDVCGIFLGLQPNDRTSTIGLWYRMRYLEGRFQPAPLASGTKHGGAADIPASTHRIESYQALEVRGEFWLGERWSILGMVPLVNNYASSNGGVDADIYGVADPSVMGRWIAVNTKQKADTVHWRHRLTLGLGVKAPLASKDRSYAGRAVDFDLQPGTGTWDGLISVEYLVRHADWGMGVSSVGRFNTTDDQGRRGGHGVNVTHEFFHVFEGKRTQWMPVVGAYGEWMAQDRYDGTDDPGTGGTTLFTHVGARFWYHQWGINLTWQHAIARDQGADMMPNRERVVGGLTWMLK